MNSIKEFGILDNNLNDEISNFINNFQCEMNPSKLYSKETESLIVDFEIRSSKFRLITDENLFLLIDQLISKINNLDKTMDFILNKNNVTHIRYEKGDFFKEHEDFLSVTSNVIQEYSMIFCLDANCTGGETVLKINDFFTYESKSTITKGNSLIFRKDIVHSGKELYSGYKEILTFNLWSIPKHNDDIVIITFSNLQDKYIIPYTNILEQDSLLKITFEEDPDKIKFFEVFNFTFEDFQVIYNILMKKYISLTDWNTNIDVINYFNIDVKNVLFTQSVYNTIQHETINFKDDLILVNSSEDAKYINSLIKQQYLNYIPFLIVFAEGKNVFGGGMTREDPLKYKMDPIFCSFSDYNSILFITKLMDRSIILSKYNYSDESYNFEFENPEDLNEPIISFTTNYSDESEKNIYETFVEENQNYTEEIENVEVELKYLEKIDIINKNNTTEINAKKVLFLYEDEQFLINQGLIILNLKYSKKYLTLKKLTEHFLVEDKNIFLDGVLHNTSKLNSIEGNKNYKTYHLDSEGYSFLDQKQQQNVLDKIKEIDLLKSVKNKINTLKLIFPQIKASSSHHFCNEDVYSNMNLIFVNGFLKL